MGGSVSKGAQQSGFCRGIRNGFPLNQDRRSSFVYLSRLRADNASIRRPRLFSSTIKIKPDGRIHGIFGANTDVGKTILSTGLVRAAMEQPNNTVYYIKPLQSGGSDQGFVQRHATKENAPSNLQTFTLFEWDTPASPHTVSKLENKPVSDHQVLHSLTSTLSLITSKKEPSTTIIETAGGVLSPSSASPDNNSPKHAMSQKQDTEYWGWMPQGDLYQPFVGQMSVVLVGDGRLGGISATISSLESLVLRGYDVSAIVLLESGYENLNALREYASRGFKIRSGSGEPLFQNPEQSILSLPAVPEDISVPLDEWFLDDRVVETFEKLNCHLQYSWEGQVSDLKDLRRKGRNVVWWPFTQHGNIETDGKVTLIDSACGDNFQVLTDTEDGNLEKRPMFDACASWWTQGVGHGESSMALASAAAAGRYGHVIFPDVVHAPAVALSEHLVGPKGPGYEWASRVFFTDDGSTAVEVALKMGMNTFQERMGLETIDGIELVTLAQVDCYHGDTLGVMDVAEPSIFNEGQHPWYESKGLFLDTPTLAYQNGTLRIIFPEGSEPTSDTVTEFKSIADVMDVDARILSRKLYSQYKELIEMQWLVYEHKSVNKRIASVVIEPVLMGAGGMKFVDPLWQRALMDVARSRNVPIIFDEVASGLHRVGVISCREILRENPDIGCYAKLLTGGLLPLSVTLATEEVFNVFLGNEKGQALLHGHSYTAHPVGCVGALQALESYNSIISDDRIPSRPRMLFDESMTRDLSHLPLVEKCFTLGTVVAVTIKTEGAGGYGASSRTIPIVEKLRQKGVYARPLGNVVYIMASPLTSKEECRSLLASLYDTINEYGALA